MEVVNRSAKKTLISLRERILLHLLSIHKFNQDADAPRAASQEGVAQATGIGRNNVTKLLSEMGQLGEVETYSRHVKGTPSSRKVYFLTQQGFAMALALKRELEGTLVTVTDMVGAVHEDQVGRLQLYLPRQFGLLELAMGVVRGKFDCQSFHEGMVKEERRFVDYTDRKPAVRSFYGREAEMEELTRFLESEYKVMVVLGIAGIGKTTLLARFAQERRERANIFWFKVHEWIDGKAFLRPLGEFLSQVGKKGLEWYLAQTEVVNVNEVCHVLESELKDSNVLWIIDDAQKAGEEVRGLLSALLGTIEAVPGVKIVCSSREKPAFYTRSWVLRGVVREMMLEGLDHESSLDLMRERHVPEESFEDIFRVTNGHPLFMELVEDPKNVLGKNVRAFMEEEVLSKLDMSERSILEIASVFRYPITTDAFFIMEEKTHREAQLGVGRTYKDYLFDYDTIDGLLRKSLLKETTGGLVAMHDVLRDFLYNRLPPRQRTLLHLSASSYYMQDISAPSSVEALYHSMMANECPASVRIAAGNGRTIITRGYANQLAPLLDNLMSRCKAIEGPDLQEILLLQAEIMDIRGEWDRAMERYSHIDRTASPERDPRLKAEVKRRIGVIWLRRYQYDEALRHLKEAERLASSLADLQTLAGILYDIGGVLERKGDAKGALESFTHSQEFASQAGDDVGRGKAFYGMGRTYGQLSDEERSISYKRSALEVLERVGAINEIAKVCASLGSDLLNEGLKVDALATIERAVELASSIGDLNTLGYSLINLAGCHIELGNLESAEPLLDRAAGIASKLNERYLSATIMLYKGYLHAKRGEWEWAKVDFDEALQAMRSLNSPTRLSWWLYEVAKIFAENGDLQGGLPLLKEALELAHANGQDRLCRLVEDLIGESTV